MSRNIPQAWRVAIFGVYVIVLLLANYLLFDSIVPSSLWFWAAFLSLLLSELIAQPFFTAPRDSLGNSIAALSTSVAVVTEGTVPANTELWWIILVIASLAIAGISAFAMVAGEAQSQKIRLAAYSSTQIVAILGSPKLLFTPIFYLAILAEGYDETTIVLLSLIWILLVLGRPFERAANLVIKIRNRWGATKAAPIALGSVLFRRNPRLVTISSDLDKGIKVGSSIVIPVSEGNCQLAVVVDNHRLTEQSWSPALIYAENVIPKDVIESVELLEIGKAYKPDQIPAEQESTGMLESAELFIGCVIEKSDINTVHVELHKDDAELREGQLLSIEIGDVPVLYQITNGVTESEVLAADSRHGYLSLVARKLGRWEESKQGFQQVPWTPKIYSPVFLTPQNEEELFSDECIGYVPNSNFGIRADIDVLVTHNTAILGVLGSGKTSLAIELIMRMISEGIKVWIVDITKQYEIELAQFISVTKQDASDQRIKDGISATAATISQDKTSGGNHNHFSSILKAEVRHFLDDSEWKVRVLDPTDFYVTEQTSGVFGGTAGIGTASITTITRSIAEALLENVKGEMSENAKVCLVLEEAHSLIPEFNSSSHEGDKSATNGTAKAIMQGRKYGMGCLVITQRTANVTKSVLNQCNTVFGLRVFDNTGIDFLGNYVGSGYASLLTTLPDRHCVAFGKGLNSSGPVIIRLNDREQFRAGYQMPENTYVEGDGFSAVDQLGAEEYETGFMSAEDNSYATQNGSHNDDEIPF